MSKFYVIEREDATLGTRVPLAHTSPTLSTTSQFYTVPGNTTNNGYTYYHPIWVSYGQAYSISAISMTSIRQLTSDRVVQAVVYLLDSTGDNASLVRKGSNTTISTAAGWHQRDLTLLNDVDTGNLLLTGGANQALGGQTYLIGFQTVSASADLQIRYIVPSTGTEGDSADQNIASSFANSEANNWSILSADNPSGTVTVTAIPSTDFHMSIVGDGPPPRIMSYSATRTDKRIDWSFSMPADWTTPYTLYTLVNTSVPNPSALPAKGTFTSSGNSVTTFFKDTLTVGQTYYPYTYLTTTVVGVTNSGDIGYGTGSTAISVPTIASFDNNTPLTNSSFSQGSGSSANQITLNIRYAINGSALSTNQAIRIVPSDGSAAIDIPAASITAQPQVVPITTGWSRTLTFAITATNSVGTSSILTSPSFIIPVEPSIPTAPTNLTVSTINFNTGALSLTWTASSFGNGSNPRYRLERAATTRSWTGSAWSYVPPTTWTTLSSTLSSSFTSYSDAPSPALNPYTPYAYRLTAITDNGSASTIAYGITDGGRVNVATSANFAGSVKRYLERADLPNQAQYIKVYRYTGNGTEGGWEPTQD